MARETDSAGGGVGLPPSGAGDRPAPRREDISASAIRANASGFGYLSYFLQGRYHDLSNDGRNISESNDSVVMASVPPGDSFNSSHYATTPGEPRGRSDAELLAATIELRGEMRESVTCEYTWRNPDGDEMFSGSTSLGNPGADGYEYWEYAYFYSWVGRDFSQGGTPEIQDTGDHQIEFDTNYGTYTRTFDVTGPSITSCSLPNTVTSGRRAQVSARVANGGSGSYNGEVRWVRDSDRRDVLASGEFNVGPTGTDTVNAFIDAGDVAPSEDVVAYCLV